MKGGCTVYFWSVERAASEPETFTEHAHHQSTRQTRSQRQVREVEVSSAHKVPAASWSLPSGHDSHAEKAELRAS